VEKAFCARTDRTALGSASLSDPELSRPWGASGRRPIKYRARFAPRRGVKLCTLRD
jgi:hypothetical protein